MLMNKTSEGRIICPKCGQHEVSIIITGSEYVYLSFWHRIKSIFSLSRIGNTAGTNETKTYICNKCGFKVSDRIFIAWYQGKARDKGVKYEGI